MKAIIWAATTLTMCRMRSRGWARSRLRNVLKVCTYDKHEAPAYSSCCNRREALTAIEVSRRLSCTPPSLESLHEEGKNSQRIWQV